MLSPAVLGIDPGLNITGYAVLEVAPGGPRLCEAGRGSRPHRAIARRARRPRSSTASPT